MKSGIVKIALSVLFMIIISLAASPVSAALPQTIGFQGYLTTSTGEPINGQVNITFSLYKADNSVIWTETQTDVAVNKGVYSAQLGSVVSLNALPFDEPYYLGVAVANDPEMAPRQVLTSVGYAMRSRVSDAASAGAVVTDSIAPGAVTPSKLASVCSEGDLLVRSAAGWVCSSSAPNLVNTQRPWGCSADRTVFTAATCSSECASDGVSASLCSNFCNSASLAAFLSGGYTAKYCGR